MLTWLRLRIEVIMPDWLTGTTALAIICGAGFLLLVWW